MPSIKQKKAFDNAVENGGNMGKAMIDAGYSPNTAKTPQKLTNTQAWQGLMDEYLPDDSLALKHRQLLNDEESAIQVKALDMAYKLKGNYAPEKSINLNMQANVADPRALDIARKYEEELKKEL